MGYATFFLLTLCLPYFTESLNCDKVFNYYEDYGSNGFDIICQGITKGYENVLSNIAVYNEMNLTISDSVFQNVTSNLFNNVKGIRYFYLLNSTFAVGQRQSVFEKLKKLRHLVIENTKFNVSTDIFKGLSRLEELVLDNNSISKIPENSLLHLSELNTLRIVRNKLTNISDVPLCELRKLTNIDFQGNDISDLKYNFLCKKRSESLDFRLNSDSLRLDLPGDFFSVTEGSYNLVDINLGFNRISDLGRSFSGLASLRRLNLEGNRLTQIKPRTMSSLVFLERLVLKNNSLSVLGENFDRKITLKYIDLSHNKLTQFSINYTPTLEYLDIANNVISVITLNSTKLLTFLDLSHNKLVRLETSLFKDLKNLVSLNLSSNSLVLNDNSFDGLEALEYLYLSENNLTVLPPAIFESLTNLRELDLSRNKLSSLPTNSIFSSLSKLEKLNISYNNLKDLHFSLLQPLQRLVVLDIGGNKLSTIQYDLIISNLPSLSVINIKANLLTCDFLANIIKYLKARRIGYTVSEHFDYERENVAGIYCNTTLPVSNSLLESRESSILFDLSVISIIVLVTIISGILAFKIFVFLKRRKYKADEFELIEE